MSDLYGFIIFYCDIPVDFHKDLPLLLPSVSISVEKSGGIEFLIIKSNTK